MSTKSYTPFTRAGTMGALGLDGIDGMSKARYKVQCGQSFVEYQSDFEHKSQERIEELTRLVTEMEVRRLNRDIEQMDATK